MMYRHFTRRLIQFDPSCARYDPELTYTLRPGTCSFSNVEFDNRYQINRLGLRDTDEALSGPEIIVIGDSHAMGWGVEQDENLVAVIAKRTGMKTLNAAVSSYGTVRALKMLDRIDTSKLRVLVIQYADNDLVENQTFQQHGNTLPITDRNKYDEIVHHYAGQQSYFPGKYSYRLFMKVTRLEPPEPDSSHMRVVSPSQEAELFLGALMHAGRTPLDNVLIIVFPVVQQLELADAFKRALAEETHKPDRPPWVRRIVSVNTSEFLSAGDFYVLDDHMNAQGHRRVGERLADEVR
jgi:hypothetical protein